MGANMSMDGVAVANEGKAGDSFVDSGVDDS